MREIERKREREKREKRENSLLSAACANAVADPLAGLSKVRQWVDWVRGVGSALAKATERQVQ